MARKGKLPVKIPSGVDVKLDSGKIMVKGPKGTLSQIVPVSDVVFTMKDQQIHVSIAPESEMQNLHGLWRTLVDNMVVGVTKGFQKQLELVGVGYRAQVQGKNLNLTLGFSHPTVVPIPDWATVAVEKNTLITISGADKQKVGEFAADIRILRPPEPYKGKGIRYKDEYVRKKAGKAAAKK